jgi:cytochrome c oxidase subunit II
MIGAQGFALSIVIGVLAAICLVILGLISRVMLRRRALSPAAENTASSQTSRDLFWTITPLLVFVVVSVPLMRLLYLRNAIPAADLTITVTARMWYWTFDYSGHGNFSFAAPMLPNSTGKITAAPRSAMYDHIVVPVAKTVRIVAVGTNVIYSWAIPSIGAKIQALPGQTNQSWFVAAKEGRYYGQCSELCALPHEFRPIEVEVVSQKRFDKWAAEAREKLASAALPAPHTRAETR